jgi:hypothetical protein
VLVLENGIKHHISSILIPLICPRNFFIKKLLSKLVKHKLSEKLLAKAMEINLRTLCRSDKNNPISELGAEAMENNLRIWCRSDDKHLGNFQLNI